MSRSVMPWFAAFSVGLASMLCVNTARAHAPQPSEASALSVLPVAMSVGASGLMVVGTAAFSVVAIQATAEGVVWVLERASDGARTSVRWAASSAGVASVAVGTTLMVTAVSAGWVVSTAGEVIALVPNALGRALLHHEEVQR
ncbi:hypothetical protein EYS42_07215 [Aquabacterium lacunae]|uniref:Uncharacterized protein n=1 Tax=Aquabacterium lacunae TaxID=2528630 RepID=A0A4Q9H0X6_9BURK|nr:hypothetical protein [Aquabacterium lacunae]TBO32943.1 hypothetical protein EYS42_07215 [Aquabacterium lacunae]